MIKASTLQGKKNHINLFLQKLYNYSREEKRQIIEEKVN